MRLISNENHKKLILFLQNNNIDWLYIEDSSFKTEPIVRYLCGHPQDSTYILNKNGEEFLIPWDLNLSHEYAKCTNIINLRRYKNSIPLFLKDLLSSGEKILFYNKPIFLPLNLFKINIKNIEVVENNKAIKKLFNSFREIKNEKEILIIRKAATITNNILEKIKKQSQLGKTYLKEIDIHNLIQKECILSGCYGLAFNPLIANSKRSFFFHPYPNVTSKNLITDGFNLIDFGVNYKFLFTDVTITFVSGKIKHDMLKIIETVKFAYEKIVSLLKHGRKISEIKMAYNEILHNAGFNSYHDFGHSLGIEYHDIPIFNDNTVLRENMYLSIEPAIYSLEYGGIRIENNILIKKDGCEILTNSEIISC
jgi:Xaa-Pro aminopeptidase